MHSANTLSSYELERNKPLPSINHGRIQANLIFDLITHYRNAYSVASEVMLDLNEISSVPDIIIYEKTTIDSKNNLIAMKKTPLCTVEIVSPCKIFADVLTKTYTYFLNGVKSCWIVLPGVNNFYVFSGPDTYQIFKSDQTLQDPTLNISFSLAEVFI